MHQAADSCWFCVLLSCVALEHGSAELALQGGGAAACCAGVSGVS
jgi:hypothetical protein